jgi:hypothetical protein
MEDKKIIIDEDWKSQVQAEKEAQKQQPDKSAPGQRPAATDDIPMPPPSFELLLTTLVTEAMIALGQVPNPITGQTVFHAHQAKYLIDMIEMLKEKTKGNLTPDEAQLVDHLLHQLRMAFISLTAPSGIGAESHEP